MKKAVFLDRDGVINRSKFINGVPKPPSTVSEVEIIEGVISSIQTLNDHNFILVVVTNQPDVARGLTSQSSVDAINAYVGAVTKIEHFYTCIHDDTDNCDCRKPSPGLINMAARELNIDLTGSYLVGDRWRDIRAGQAAGCKCYFIDYFYPEPRPELPFTRVSSLAEATRDIIGELCAPQQ